MSSSSLEDVNPVVSTIGGGSTSIHHVGKSDFPTCMCGEVCGLLAYYLIVWVSEPCREAREVLVDISCGSAENDLDRELIEWRSPPSRLSPDPSRVKR